jgi:hypothetical protein
VAQRGKRAGGKKSASAQQEYRDNGGAARRVSNWLWDYNFRRSYFCLSSIHLLHFAAWFFAQALQFRPSRALKALMREHPA